MNKAMKYLTPKKPISKIARDRAEEMEERNVDLYTVTADYTGTVSRIALNRVRYVAIFEGTPIQPAEPANVPSAASAFRWSYVLIPLGIVAAAGAGVGGALLVKHRKENADEEDATE